jgi:hypothetical protein
LNEYTLKTVKAFGIILLVASLAAAYGRSGILVHPAPVLFHRFQVLEFLIADVALERSSPTQSKEAPHAL